MDVFCRISLQNSRVSTSEKRVTEVSEAMREDSAGNNCAWLGGGCLLPVKAGRLACQLRMSQANIYCYHHDKQETLSLFRWADFPNFLSENFCQERSDTPKNNKSLVTLAFLETRVTILRKICQWHEFPCKVNFTLPFFLKHLIQNLFEGVSDKMITWTLTSCFASYIPVAMTQ